MRPSMWRAMWSDDEVLAAVEQDGGALRYASEEIKANKKVVLGAVSQCCWALEYASEELRDDEEVVLAAVIRRPRSINETNVYSNVFPYAPPPLLFCALFVYVGAGRQK